MSCSAGWHPAFFCTKCLCTNFCTNPGACAAGLATTLCGTFWYRGMKIELGELPLAYGFSPEGSSR